VTTAMQLAKRETACTIAMTVAGTAAWFALDHSHSAAFSLCPRVLQWMDIVKSAVPRCACLLTLVLQKSILERNLTVMCATLNLHLPTASTIVRSVRGSAVAVVELICLVGEIEAKQLLLGCGTICSAECHFRSPAHLWYEVLHLSATTSFA